MSLLKRAFEKACLHLKDWEQSPELKEVILVKDIRSIVQSYTYNELLFENDLFAMFHHKAFEFLRKSCFTNRLLRLFENSTSPGVLKWFTEFLSHNFWQKRTAVSMLEHSFFYLDKQLCNRIWCWNRFVYSGDSLLNVSDEDACICGFKLDPARILQLAREFII